MIKKMKTQSLILLAVTVSSMLLSCSKAKDEITSSDTTAPVITMLGKNPDTVIVKTAASYADPGATAADDHDGNITSKIIVATNVNINAPGHYLVYYNVEDNAHNLAPKLTRVVEVVTATATYDATSTCFGVPSGSITIVSNSTNDTITINDFYSTGTVIKAFLNNYKFQIIPITISGETINGDLTANGTTLNGNIVLTGTIPGNCTSTFTRH
jgi:hypothetical protein